MISRIYFSKTMLLFTVLFVVLSSWTIQDKAWSVDIISIKYKEVNPAMQYELALGKANVFLDSANSNEVKFTFAFIGGLPNTLIVEDSDGERIEPKLQYNAKKNAYVPQIGKKKQQAIIIPEQWETKDEAIKQALLLWCSVQEEF